MGTRADFYVGRGRHARWIGSVAYDGYGVATAGTEKPFQPNDKTIRAIAEAKSAHAFERAVTRYVKERDHGTLPGDGWPWPWEDSCTTDYAYCFDINKGRVLHYCFGARIIRRPSRSKRGAKHVTLTYTKKKVTFPNMRDRMRVTLGPRSGLLVLVSD